MGTVRAVGAIAVGVALVAFGTPARAWLAPADTAAASDSTAGAKKGFFERFHEPRLEWGGLIYLPKVYYSAETSVGIGGELLHTFAYFGSQRDSDVELEGRMMAKGQGEAGATLNLGWTEDRRSAKSKVVFTNIPRYFYGIGPDTPSGAKEVFQRQSLLYYLELFHRVVSHVRVGVRAEAEQAQVLQKKPDGLLDHLTIPGVKRSTVVGAGVLADWDSRNDRFWPTRGGYYQAFYMKFDDGLQSDFNFDVTYAELRQFIPTATNHVLALQAIVYSTKGNPPFWRLAEMGGRSHSRGYERGRYRDKVLIAFQAEHRFAVWRRLGLVGFAGLADVAPRLRRMKLEHMRPTYGGGVRFRVGGIDHRVNARLDLAYGEGFHLYFKLGEAF